MKLKAVVLPASDKNFAPGAIAGTARDIPVTVDFDPSRIVGKATVYPDGSAELELNVPLETVQGEGGFGLGYRVDKQRVDGDQVVVEQLRPITVGITAEMLEKLKKQ